MTKPECSKQKASDSSVSTEKDSTIPATAKDLFADFVPEESDSGEEDVREDEKKDENSEPASKKSKDSNSKVS